MEDKVIAALILAFLVLVEPQASVQKPADGPNVKFEDSFIENLVGEWNLTRSIRGQTVRSKVTAKWVLNHQFLELHMVDTAAPPTYEALVLIGYSHADHRYVAQWCDTFGGKFSGVGYG